VGVEKAVFSLSCGSTSTCQYPEARSSVVNKVDPARESSVASTLGRGYRVAGIYYESFNFVNFANFKAFTKI